MRYCKRLGAGLVLSFLLAPSSGGTQQAVLAQGEGPPSSATSTLYATKKVEGWTVLVNKELMRQQPELVEQVLKELEHQLYQIVRACPSGRSGSSRRSRSGLKRNSLITRASSTAAT